MDPEPSETGDHQVTLSYYSGHGLVLPSGDPHTGCNHDSDCPSTPPSGYYGSPICTQCPGATCHPTVGKVGVCRYRSHSTALVNGGFSEHCQAVDWGNPSAGTVWGESSFQHWFTEGGNNAGTNGGVNMIASRQSFGGTPGFWPTQTQNLFAGLHLFGSTSPTNGDVHDSTMRGSAFAGTAISSTSSIGDGWVASGATLTDGGGCVPGVNAGGYDGCGCTYVISWAYNQFNAIYHVETESWANVQDDSLDESASNTWAILTSCNYDLASYPWSTP
jgi:hypothetical protein